MTTIDVGHGLFALVDDDDVERVRAVGPWHVTKAGYVMANGRMKNRVKAPAVYLHRLLMDCSAGDGTHVDHLNHDTLDNRRSNLRVGPPWQNAQNQHGHRDARTSEHRGVSYCATSGVWKANHMLRGVKWSKNCATEEEAVAAVTAHRGEVCDGRD